MALQRRLAGNILDDLVLRSRTDAIQIGIDFQIKRTASPVASDTAFIDALSQCIDAMDQQPTELAEGRLQLGFAASEPRGQLEQLKRLTELARSHATTDTFLGVLVPGATAREVRERYGHIKKAVTGVLTEKSRTLDDAETDTLTFRLLKYLRVWIFEVGDDGRDVLEAQSRLATILPADGPGTHTVFSELRNLAETWGPSAGVIDAPMVRAALFARGIPLTADPRHRVELDRVLEASRQELARTVDRIGGTLRLERATAVERLAQAIGPGIVLVAGAAGVGKSVLARHAVQRLSDKATVVAISLTTRGGDTLAAVQQELGVSHLPTTLAAAATSGPRVLLIDGAEHALTDSGRLLEALLGAAPTDGSSSPPWAIVITCRTDAAGPLTERLGERLTATIELDELSDKEVDEVGAAFPALAPLTRHPRSKRLLRRPYLVDLMVRSHAAPTADEVLGEEDVIAVVHEKVVRRNEGLTPGQGSAHDRDVAWNTLAEAIIDGKGTSRLHQVNGEAVSGLVSDDILRRKGSTYRFAHDVLADYATAMRLSDDDGNSVLSTATNPRSLLRAVRLTSQRKLADTDHHAETQRAWTDILDLCRDLSDRDGSRWNEVPFEALTSVGSPDRILDDLTPSLLANEAAQLGQLIDVTSRYAATSRHEPDGTRLLLDDVLAAPVITLLATLSERVPKRLTVPATRLIRRWLISVEIHGRRAETLAPDPTLLSATVARWAREDQYGDRYESALAVVGLLGRDLSADARALLDHARGHDLDVVAENSEVAAALARDNPSLLLEIAGRYYLDLALTLDPDDPGRRPRRPGRRRRRSELSGYEGEEGVRDHSHHTSFRQGFGLAGPNWGPFATLLENSPTHGLRLVGAVVDAATAARMRVEQSFGKPSNAARLQLKLPHWDQAVTYEGPATAWAWYRKAGNGAWSAKSALMALRGWAKKQLETRTLADVVDDVLSAGASVAFPAVGYSLLVPNPLAAGDLIDAFLEHPEVWDLEIGRTVGVSGITEPADDEETALRQPPERIGGWLALNGNAQRQAALTATGQRLLDRSRAALGDPAADDPRLAIARRRALALNAKAYQVTQTSEQPGMVEAVVDVPADVQQELERAGGRAALLSLTLSNTTFQARKIRDGQANEPPAAQLYRATMDILQAITDTPGAYPLYTADETRAVAAAAVVVQAAASTDPERALLTEAVGALMQVANNAIPKVPGHRSDRDMSMDMSADRSAATALPVVLLNDELLTNSGATRSQVVSALQRLATCTSREVRDRLTQGLEPGWSRSCRDDQTYNENHATTITVYHRLLMSARTGPSEEGTQSQIPETATLEAAFHQTGTNLDLRAAADALSGLKTAAACDCDHAETARVTLAALVSHDLSVWPNRWANHNYDGARTWRREIDGWTAAEVLAGDDALLERYLAGFATAPQQLAGLVVALASQAISPEQGRRLFGIWPTILDRLLPGARRVPDSDERRPSRRDEAGLDAALLPKPSEGAVWPGREWVQAILRWTHAYAPRPSLCERLIDCLIPTGLLFVPAGAKMVLRMLGSDAAQISDDSRYVVAWLRLAALEHRESLQAQQPEIRQLVDDLAARGSADATLIQRELEA
ncbi:hypothetical protein AB0F72_41995 [Actinoplanes sp. NPDC023936]|uniref:hypothetical protein n=1 Tax=Actinoplanes sp. NPDC023936 TaxID=3154910 RepID=UPI0033DC72F0